MEPARIYSGFEMTNPSLGSAKLIINGNSQIVGAVTLPMTDYNDQNALRGFAIRGTGFEFLSSTTFLL